MLIFEMTRDELITNVWAQNEKEEEAYRQRFIGVKVGDIRNDALMAISREHIRKAFEKQERGYVEYKTIANGLPLKLNIRIIPAPYDKNFVLSIIERVKVEEHNEIIEDKWKMALDASGDGMWDSNMETGKISFSEKWHEIFGYTEDEISTSAQWSEKIHPDDIKTAQKNFEEYLAGRIPVYTAEIRYKCKDGTYKWILSRGTSVKSDANGKPLRFIGTHTDIHSRKVQQQAMEESERRYKVLFNYSEAMICTHDTNGIIIDVNPFVTDSLGYQKETLIGRNLAELVPPKVRDLFKEEYLNSINKAGTARGMMQIMKSNGEKRILLYHNYLFKEQDAPPYIIGIAQDITERVRAEEQLKSSVDTFSSAFKYSGIGMALTNTKGQWVEVNEALSQITGYSKEELLKINFQDITHPDDRGDGAELVRKMLAKELDSSTLEKRYIAKGGRIIWVSVTVSLVWNSDGSPKFFIAQVVDITERKMLNSQLREKNKELEATKQSLINKVSQLEELSYIIAHNLRGPAKNINMLNEILMVKHGMAEPTEDTQAMSEAISQDEAVEMVHTAGKSLVASLESLLSIAQIRLNKDIPYDDCDCAAIIEQITNQLKGTIVETGATIHLALDVKKIHYPKVYLESILYNLISNAIKYRNPQVPVQITVSTSIQGRKTRLSVKDNGLGIDLKRHGHKVFKLNQVFHSNADSKGVGLYLVKTQIESLGGSIGVQTKPNEGAEFIVML